MAFNKKANFLLELPSQDMVRRRRRPRICTGQFSSQEPFNELDELLDSRERMSSTQRFGLLPRLTQSCFSEVYC